LRFFFGITGRAFHPSPIGQVIRAKFRAARAAGLKAGLADPDVTDLEIGLRAAAYALTGHLKSTIPVRFCWLGLRVLNRLFSG
jgi:hypothetical protein